MKLALLIPLAFLAVAYAAPKSSTQPKFILRDIADESNNKFSSLGWNEQKKMSRGDATITVIVGDEADDESYDVEMSVKNCYVYNLGNFTALKKGATLESDILKGEMLNKDIEGSCEFEVDSPGYETSSGAQVSGGVVEGTSRIKMKSAKIGLSVKMENNNPKTLVSSEYSVTLQGDSLIETPTIPEDLADLYNEAIQKTIKQRIQMFMELNVKNKISKVIEEMFASA